MTGISVQQNPTEEYVSPCKNPFLMSISRRVFYFFSITFWTFLSFPIHSYTQLPLSYEGHCRVLFGSHNMQQPNSADSLLLLPWLHYPSIMSLSVSLSLSLCLSLSLSVSLCLSLCLSLSIYLSIYLYLSSFSQSFPLICLTIFILLSSSLSAY